jgi:hypothetical protein
MTITSPRSLRHHARDKGKKKRQTPEREGRRRAVPRTGTYRVLVDGHDWRSGFISRGDVADFLVRSAIQALFHKNASADRLTGQIPTIG